MRKFWFFFFVNIFQLYMLYIFFEKKMLYNIFRKSANDKMWCLTSVDITLKTLCLIIISRYVFSTRSFFFSMKCWYKILYVTYFTVFKSRFSVNDYKSIAQILNKSTSNLTRIYLRFFSSPSTPLCYCKIVKVCKCEYNVNTLEKMKYHIFYSFYTIVWSNSF